MHKLLRGYRKCTYVPGMSCSYWCIYCCVLFDCIWANKMMMMMNISDAEKIAQFNGRNYFFPNPIKNGRDIPENSRHERLQAFCNTEIINTSRNDARRRKAWVFYLLSREFHVSTAVHLKRFTAELECRQEAYIHSIHTHTHTHKVT